MADGILLGVKRVKILLKMGFRKIGLEGGLEISGL